MKLKSFLQHLLQPKAEDQDLARREYILNILLLSCVFIAFVTVVIAGLNVIRISQRESYVSIQINLSFFFLFCFLLWLSKKGFSKFSAAFFVIFLIIPGIFLSLGFGSMVGQAILMYALAIIVCGILIGSRASFVATIAISIYIAVLSYLQSFNLVSFDKSWFSHVYEFGDSIIASITLGIIAIISWLSNREIEKALNRALTSEKALREERDMLEVKVEERTRELKQAQLEKLVQLYRFAEFGRLASGIFHDLATPLTLVSLNLKKLSNDTNKISHFKTAIERALIGTKKLESFIVGAKRQLQNQEVLEVFSVSECVQQALQMLDHRAKEANVKISFKPAYSIELLGNPLKFNQLIINLTCNAIDAYEDIKRKDKRIVDILLYKNPRRINLEVYDKGEGISKEILSKIFDPLFTTKGHEYGTGIGLSICKSIVEKDFKGSINVKSKKGEGTRFTVKIPVPQN